MNARAVDLEGEPVYMTGFTELTAQKELEQRLRELATTDELTGAHNRRYFFDLGEIELQRTQRYRLSTSLAMIDVDHFKQVNDAFGHAAGDLVLQGLTTTIVAGTRPSDSLYRWGGEEFVLIAPDTAFADAAVVAERVRRSSRPTSSPRSAA